MGVAFTVDTDTDIEWPVEKPAVFIDGKIHDGFVALRVEKSGGVVPSRAILRNVGTQYPDDGAGVPALEEQTPGRTLFPSWGYTHGSRVEIIEDYNTPAQKTLSGPHWMTGS
jgi:hypothetical protein